MKLFFIILLLFPLNVLADSEYPDFCLQDIEPAEHIQTRKRLTVVRNHKIDNLILNFYGTPIWSDIAPHSEGCEDIDGKILIYDEETQKTLFHKSDNFYDFEVYLKGKEIDFYKNLFTSEKDIDFIIKHKFMSNCGCYGVLLFKKNPELLYLGSLFYNSGKYGTVEGYTEYNADNKEILLD